MPIAKLDDLPLLAELPTAKPPKLSKYERERQADINRSEAIRRAAQDFFFRSYLRAYTLQDVQRMWLEEQEKLREQRR